MKRHPDLTHEIAGFLIEIGKGNYLELFTSQLRNKINDERQFLYIIARLFESLTESLGETLVESGILEKWIENALEPANNLSESTLSALNFLTEVLLQYPQSLDHESAINLINSFKKAGKESFGNAFCIIISLFRLLESFGRNKDPLAPIIYKTLTFILIENTNSMEIRGLIMGNMMQIIEDLESIPLSIIIEPWVKHIQVSNNNNNNENNEEYHWNTIDFEFLRFLAIKDKLLIKNAIQILDLLAKTMLNDHIFAIIALETMMILIYKFITNETLMEFLSKLIKIALAIYFAAEKKRKSKIKGKQIIVSKPNPSPNELSDKDLDTIAAQKNAIIVKFLKNLAEIKNEGLNDRLKPLVAHTNLQLKKTLNTKNSDKGMMEILSLWGNAEKLSTKYENEYYESLTKEKLKKREEELRSQMKSGLGLDTTGNISRISATSNREIIDQNLNNTSFDQKQERHLQDGNSTVELASKIKKI